jgi:hypothetical protein
VAGAAILPADSSEGPSAGSATTRWCDFTPVARHLASEPSLSTRPMTVAAMMDAGPPILYFTTHRVLAAPYGNEGIVAVHELLNATRDDRALALMTDRQVDLVLLCPAREGGFFHRTGDSGEPTLYGRLLDGTPPPWLEPVPLPDGLQGAHLFRYVEAPGGPASTSRGSNSP